MKRTSVIGLILVSITMTWACKDDELYSKELLLYIKSEEGNAHNIHLDYTQTPISIIGNLNGSFKAYLTREVSVDVKLNIEPDYSLVESYNLENEKSYEALPQSSFVLENNRQVIIEAGSLYSKDSIKIKLRNAEALDYSNDYILPLSITQIQSTDKGVQNSVTHKTVYVLVKSNGFSNILEGTSEAISGVHIDRTSWKVTANNSYFGHDVSLILDNNPVSAWSANMPAWVQLDMGSVKTIKGFSIIPSYIYIDEDILTMDVSISNDGNNWNFQGVYKGSATNRNSSAANPDVKNLKFIDPISARYVRFEIKTSNGGLYTGMGELYGIE